jgi:multidrug resistance efflux pump
MDRQYGLIYDRIPARTDDLTRISGLHPREAAQLNKQGIFCFGQIALWRHREQVRFAEDLQIPFSRIVDEAWVSQARELCRDRSRPVSGFLTGGFRTLTTLICALLIGVLFVWLIASQHNAPLAGILIADVTQVKLPANAAVRHIHVRPGDEVFTGQKLLTMENSALLASRVLQQKRVREAERTVQRLEARLLFEQETRRAELSAATVKLQQDLSRQRPGQSLARSGAGASGILFFSASAKSTPLAATGPPAATPESKAQGSLVLNASDSSNSGTRGARILAAASPALMTDPGRNAAANKAAATSGTPAAAGDSSGSESLRAELARLEALQKNLQQHVAAAIGLTQAREFLLEAQEELQRLQTAETELLIAAPSYGLVGTVDVEVGDQLASGKTVIRMLHPDRRSVVVQLPGSRLPELSAGEMVEIHFPGARGYEGRVVSISPMTTAEAFGSESRIAVKIEPVGRVWPTVPVGCDVQVCSWK